MRVHGQPYRSIWYDEAHGEVRVIDQRWLPHRFTVAHLRTVDEVAVAIRDMWVRGAPLIGAAAAWGLALAMAEDAGDTMLARAAARLRATRPTAINLNWAIDRVLARLAPLAPAARADSARAEACSIADADVQANHRIGMHGLAIVRQLADALPSPRTLRVLTHCNAGWLATVDHGTATAPIYAAHDAGIPLHVWVDETRPRNQGAALTCWELGGHGVPHRLVADNAGGHLMQQGQVDLVIVGSDRTTAGGDVCNKIGTYLKALAAHAHGVPFYVALPTSTIDWSLDDGVGTIPIEERHEDEVTTVSGRLADGTLATVRIAPDGTRAANPAFDVTPRHLVTGLITEHGVVAATPQALAPLRRAPADVATGRPDQA